MQCDVLQRHNPIFDDDITVLVFLRFAEFEIGDRVTQVDEEQVGPLRHR